MWPGFEPYIFELITRVSIMELSDWRKVLPMDSTIRVDDSVASLVMAWVVSKGVERRLSC